MLQVVQDRAPCPAPIPGTCFSALLGDLPVPSMMSEGWSTSYEQGSLGIGTGSISDRAGRDSWLELRDCPFSRESSSFDMESSPSASARRRLHSETTPAFQGRGTFRVC